MTASAERERVELAVRARRQAPSRPRLPAWAEAVIAVVAYELYNVVQAATSGSLHAARLNGIDLVHAEKALHMWVEPTVNHWATVHSWVGLAAGYYYELAHVTGTLLVLTFLWWRRPAAYVRLRNGLLALSLVALAVFWRWPVAPPRLTVPGFTDTLITNDILGAAHVHGVFDLYAAMPSLHVAWACWCAGAIVLTVRHPARHVAWLYPLLTTFAVVATSNHYLLDAVAGAALALGTLVVIARPAAVWSSPSNVGR